MSFSSAFLFVHHNNCLGKTYLKHWEWDKKLQGYIVKQLCPLHKYVNYLCIMKWSGVGYKCTHAY
jgi:hypothetical protein